jgi:hypothetical protein
VGSFSLPANALAYAWQAGFVYFFWRSKRNGLRVRREALRKQIYYRVYLLNYDAKESDWSLG